MTRRRIPLFPLPDVVLLPGTLLPLHIFEPRYRAMVADALAGDRTIGMAMIRPGRESSGPTPKIHPVGGAGRIVEAEELSDDRLPGDGVGGEIGVGDNQIVAMPHGAECPQDIGVQHRIDRFQHSLSPL